MHNYIHVEQDALKKSRFNLEGEKARLQSSVDETYETLRQRDRDLDHARQQLRALEVREEQRRETDQESVGYGDARVCKVWAEQGFGGDVTRERTHADLTHINTLHDRRCARSLVQRARRCESRIQCSNKTLQSYVESGLNGSCPSVFPGAMFHCLFPCEWMGDCAHCEHSCVHTNTHHRSLCPPSDFSTHQLNIRKSSASPEIFDVRAFSMLPPKIVKKSLASPSPERVEPGLKLGPQTAPPIASVESTEWDASLVENIPMTPNTAQADVLPRDSTITM